MRDYDVQNGAAAIAMDVNTGAVLAMASLGNFDLNNYQIVSDDARAIIDAEENEEQKAELRKAMDARIPKSVILSFFYPKTSPGEMAKIREQYLSEH